jgi:hypothetical protein
MALKARTIEVHSVSPGGEITGTVAVWNYPSTPESPIGVEIGEENVALSLQEAIDLYDKLGEVIHIEQANQSIIQG